MTRFALVFLAAPACADSVSISGTMVSLEPAPAPAVAQVVMRNVQMNGSRDDGFYVLTMPGLTVEAQFTWDAALEGHDRLTVTPPDGFVCQPADCSMTVAEGSTGIVLLLPWIGG